MDYTQQISDRIIFRDPASGHFGYFALMKSIFVVDGVYPSVWSGRCDNLTYNSTFVTYQTPYHDESMYAGENIPIANWGYWNRVIDATPDFCIMFMSCKEPSLTPSFSLADYYFEGFPSTLWFGKTLIELFKNIREWSFMVEEPFNSDHPMAYYSKKAIDVLEIPQFVLDEIDSLPDMHLARFLKGDPDHRDLIEDFPQMSDEMKSWFTDKLEQFKPISTNQRLLELNID